VVEMNVSSINARLCSIMGSASFNNLQQAVLAHHQVHVVDKAGGENRQHRSAAWKQGLAASTLPAAGWR
jgi:hypothetical protein